MLRAFVAIGEPGAGYPMPWSVQTWIPGVVATDEDPGDSVAFARDLAQHVRDQPAKGLERQLPVVDAFGHRAIRPR